jgi:hypothetical protein
MSEKMLEMVDKANNVTNIGCIFHDTKGRPESVR